MAVCCTHFTLLCSVVHRCFMRCFFLSYCDVCHKWWVSTFTFFSTASRHWQMNHTPQYCRQSFRLLCSKTRLTWFSLNIVRPVQHCCDWRADSWTKHITFHTTISTSVENVSCRCIFDWQQDQWSWPAVRIFLKFPMIL